MTHTITRLLVTSVLLVACGKSKRGPSISEADKTAKPTAAQCEDFATRTVAIGANPENMKSYIRDQCVAKGSVALVKCLEPATKLADLGDCLQQYPQH